MTRGLVKGPREARVFMDEAEMCREYFKTDRITFGLSELPPGKVGGLDPGHAEADEVFFCAQGRVLCYFPEEDKYYELEKGQALLIPEKTGHRLYNNWDETAIVIWACAPHQ
jgi:mannose-6-phosphate isomerase-like protein (cupin superfamily)